MAYMTITDKEITKAQALKGDVTSRAAALKLKVTIRRAAKILLAAGFKIKVAGKAGVATIYRRGK